MDALDTCAIEDPNISVIRERLVSTESTLRFTNQCQELSSDALEIVASYLPEMRDNYVVESSKFTSKTGIILQRVSIASNNILLRIKREFTTGRLINIKIIKNSTRSYYFSEIDDGTEKCYLMYGVLMPIYKKPLKSICVPMRFTHRSFQYMKKSYVLNMMLKLKRNYASVYDISQMYGTSISLGEYDIDEKEKRSLSYFYGTNSFEVEKCCINDVTYIKRVYPALITIEVSTKLGEWNNNLYYRFDKKMRLEEIRYSASWYGRGPYGYNIYVKDESNIVVETHNHHVDSEQIAIAFGHRSFPCKFEYV
jgi:hypothetical protein